MLQIQLLCTCYCKLYLKLDPILTHNFGFSHGGKAAFNASTISDNKVPRSTCESCFLTVHSDHVQPVFLLQKVVKSIFDITKNNTSAVIWNQFVRPLPVPTLTVRSTYLSVQVVLHQTQPPKMFDFTCMYSTPGRFTIMNT